MKFWPLSAVLAKIPPECRAELLNYQLVGVSQETFQVCHSVTSRSQGFDIFMQYTEGKPLQREYLKRPTPENWLALERAVFVDTGNGFAFNVATLH